MQRILSTLILLVFISLLSAAPAKAWLFGDSPLVAIDGTEYTAEDFKRWWGFWKEPEMSFPETPDPYIDWLLLAREGQRMELDRDPGFERATKVFLMSRTLLKLKYDEVDSQIDVTDAKVRQRYDQDYAPRWGLEGMEFKDKAAASAAWEELESGSVTIADLLERDQESGGPVKTAETWLRPKDLEKASKWKAIYADLEVGEVVDPEKLGESVVLWYLKEIKAADDEDFAALREEISKKLWKEQEISLTRALIDELRTKYEVKVDDARLEALDLRADEATFTDALIVSSNQQNISEKDFIAIMRRVLKTRPMLATALQDEEATQDLKKETVYNIIAQSVTNWESLDRHYEEKEPFKWEYEFNYDQRLALSVQQRMFVLEAKASDDEIKQYYEQNKNRYSVPAQVQLYIIDETQGPIDQVWADFAGGKSIDKVFKEHFETAPRMQQVPANHLDPEVKPVVSNLADGETSSIFTAQGVRVMVHLIKRTPETVIPFERVKDMIAKDLNQKKVMVLEKDYLDTIRASSEIIIDQGEWEDLKKELGGA
jgi:hypothetical protein